MRDPREQEALDQFFGEVGSAACSQCERGRLHDFVPEQVYLRWKQEGRLLDGEGGTGSTHFTDPTVIYWSPCSDASPFTLILCVRDTVLPGLRAEIGQHCHLCDHPKA